jgi:hypothetical protein
MYGMEVFFYTIFRDKLVTECGIRAPTPLGVWKEVEAEGGHPTTVAIMMNDLAENNSCFPPLGPGQANLDDLKARQCLKIARAVPMNDDKLHNLASGLVDN